MKEGKKPLGTHFFECELELSRVQEQLKQDLGVVFGVADRLILDQTQSLVVRIIHCEDKKWRLRSTRMNTKCEQTNYFAIQFC